MWKTVKELYGLDEGLGEYIAAVIAKAIRYTHSGPKKPQSLEYMVWRLENYPWLTLRELRVHAGYTPSSVSFTLAPMRPLLKESEIHGTACVSVAGVCRYVDAIREAARRAQRGQDEDDR